MWHGHLAHGGTGFEPVQKLDHLILLLNFIVNMFRMGATPMPPRPGRPCHVIIEVTAPPPSPSPSRNIFRSAGACSPRLPPDTGGAPSIRCLPSGCYG